MKLTTKDLKWFLPLVIGLITAITSLFALFIDKANKEIDNRPAVVEPVRNDIEFVQKAIIPEGSSNVTISKTVTIERGRPRTNQ